MTAPTLTARCMASRRSMESSPVKTTALPIERVLRVEEAHLGPDFFGPDGRTVRRRNPWLTPLGRGLGGDRKGQIGHLLNADMGLGETEFP